MFSGYLADSALAQNAQLRTLNSHAGRKWGRPDIIDSLAPGVLINKIKRESEDEREEERIEDARADIHGYFSFRAQIAIEEKKGPSESAFQVAGELSDIQTRSRLVSSSSTTTTTTSTLKKPDISISISGVARVAN